MAPQGYIPVAANVLSTIGTVLWCVQLVPQVWHNWRHKCTDGLPGLMMILWAICSVPFGVYAVVQRFAIPIQVQPQVFGALALVSWGQILFYNNGWSQRNATLAVLACLLGFGGIEVLLVLTLQGPYAAGVTWPVLFIGVLADILVAAGLVPPYFELRKRQGRVIGINFVFLAVDFSGAFFSLLAVVEQETFDLLGGILYCAVLVLEAGIFISHGIWMWRFRKERRAEKEEQKKKDGVEMEPVDEEVAVRGREEEQPEVKDQPAGMDQPEGAAADEICPQASQAVEEGTGKAGTS